MSAVIATTVKLIALLAVGAGAALGTTTVAVTHSSLGPFAQALILTLVGGMVAGFCSIIAALITRQATQDVKEAVHETRSSVDDLKSKVGADRRQGE